MKIPFLVQTAGTLIGTAFIVGVAYQTFTGNDEHQDMLIQQNSDSQSVVKEEVAQIRISLSSIVTIQENQALQINRITNILERVLLERRQ